MSRMNGLPGYDVWLSTEPVYTPDFEQEIEDKLRDRAEDEIAACAQSFIEYVSDAMPMCDLNSERQDVLTLALGTCRLYWLPRDTDGYDACEESVSKARNRLCESYIQWRMGEWMNDARLMQELRDECEVEL